MLSIPQNDSRLSQSSMIGDDEEVSKEAFPRGFGGLGAMVFISGGQGNKGQIFRVMGAILRIREQKPLFGIWKLMNKPIYLRRVRKHSYSPW